MAPPPGSGTPAARYLAHPDAFPWRLSSCPQLPTARDRLRVAPLLWPPLLLRRAPTKAYRWAVVSELFGYSYLRKDFKIGVVSAVKALAGALSRNDQRFLSRALQPPLRSLFSPALARLAATGHTLHLSLRPAPRARLADVRLAFGPEVDHARLAPVGILGFFEAYEAPCGRGVLRDGDIAYAVDKSDIARLADVVSRGADPKDLLRFAESVPVVANRGVETVRVVADAEVDAEIDFQHRGPDGEVLFAETAKRTVRVLLVSSEHEVDKTGSVRNAGDREPGWTLADVDGVIQAGALAGVPEEGV